MNSNKRLTQNTNQQSINLQGIKPKKMLIFSDTLHVKVTKQTSYDGLSWFVSG